MTKYIIIAMKQLPMLNRCSTHIKNNQQNSSQTAPEQGTDEKVKRHGLRILE